MDVKSDNAFLQPEKVNAENIRSADLIVGIPSFCEADNIDFVVKKCSEGLRKYFPHHKSVIINVDNNSPDDTRSVFLNCKSQSPKIYISTPEGVRGKGNNSYNLFREAQRLKAKTVVVVDADLKSITGDWIKNLATPILSKGFHFASPLYSRNEYDGTITNNICYPLIYGLLGKNIRQPIGGDFALSIELVDYLMNQAWHKTTLQYGVDIFLTLNAILGNFKICQVALGAKIHKPSAPKLGPMFTQVVGTLFQTLLAHKSEWHSAVSVEDLPLFGNVELSKPQSLGVDYKGMKATTHYEFSINKDLLSRCLSREVYQKLNDMYETKRINIGCDLWTRIVYDLIDAYDKYNLNGDLIDAMKSLYFGRVVSFIKQTLDKDHFESEELIQRQAKYFFKHRGYLIKKYQNKQVA
jgi:glycosyltransferase involved in cell wall biosynthesis